MKIIACIPARYGSTRYPAKVLAKKTGKFLIQYTYEQACLAKLPQEVIIAADDVRIAAAAESFGAKCVMTSKSCRSGTDRIAQAVGGLRCDIVVNIQADEPEIEPSSIDKVAELLVRNRRAPMATLAAPFENEKQIADPNIVKVIIDRDGPSSSKGYADAGRAIYFSRSVIPYDRESGGVGGVKQYLRHLGIYAYRKDFLLEITKLPQSRLEKIEKLEQLRAIENGFEILVGKVKHTCDGIDTPKQYAEFVKRYRKTEKRIQKTEDRKKRTEVRIDYGKRRRFVGAGE